MIKWVLLFKDSKRGRFTQAMLLRRLPWRRSSSSPVPAPSPIAEALATLFGYRDRVLELDKAALGMNHRGLDGNDHAGLQRPDRVIALIRHSPVAHQPWRFMTDEAHAMRRKIQIGPVGRGVHELIGRRENFSPGDAAADRTARSLLDLL